ncbi:hypothetical protein SDC9_93133 [bioreactor metagenome]|uniref:Uncharacterized protein n=1 Tax=bioreactor metagenome TaxID=1076179 RepID=A0A645A6D9_9ZZZZ
MSQLPDGGGLPHAVDADEQHHGGLFREVQSCVPDIQHLRQNVPESRADRRLAGDALPLHFGPQLLHRFRGGFHTHVCLNQLFLQIVKKCLIIGRDGIAGDVLLPDFFEFAEKAHNIRPLIDFFTAIGATLPGLEVPPQVSPAVRAAVQNHF